MKSTRRRDRMAPFLLLFLLAGLAVCWTFATPLFGISDESAHVIKAAAVARGQLVGKPAGAGRTVVEIPGNLIGTNRFPCFAFRPDISAGCEAPLGHDASTVPEKTWVGYYPPFYYLVVGWPSLLFGGAAAVYAMRVVAALLGAALLTGAFLSAAEAPGRTLLLPATAALSTPYVFAYVGSVNPSGMEMAAALCAWSSGVALADGPERRYRRRILVRFVLGLVVLTQVRDFGPIFATVIAVTLACWYGPRESWHLLRHKAARLIALGVGLCAAFTAGWVLFIANLNFLPGATVQKGAGLLRLVELSAGRYLVDVEQLVGALGWANRSPPLWITVLGLGVMGGLLLLGLLRAPRRQRRIVLALLVFSVVFPIVLVAFEAGRQGLLGQGRYWFALLAGVSLAAAEAGGSRQTRVNWLLLAAVAGAVVTVHSVTFVTILDGFRVGSAQPGASRGWNPPGGAYFWPIAYATLSVSLAWWWRRSDTSWLNRRGEPADAVAKAVEHALTARRSKMRYLVVRDSRRRAIVERLPERLRDRVHEHALFRP